MGFYQVCPGKPVYSIGRPLFDEVNVSLPKGKSFVIKTVNNSADNKYIERAVLNGKELTTPFLNYKAIMAGGTLEVTLTDKPSKLGVK